jgi:hypothetical protein
MRRMYGICVWLVAVVANAGYPQVQPQTAPPPAAQAKRTVFHVKYVAHNSIYIDGGTADDLQEGMTLHLTRRPPGAPVVDTKPVGSAVIRVLASRSAVCELQDNVMAPLPGDEARISVEDEGLRAQNELKKGTRKYLQVLDFKAGTDPLEDEQHAYVPRRPVPEITRMRGSISFEHIGIFDHDSSSRSSQDGMAIHMDWKHIEGSNWSLVGYWRGALTSSSGSSTTTLLDLENRTYQFGLYYFNPLSNWSLGIGRLFVPGATSLGVVDGTYVLRKLDRHTSFGLFGGTNPDPTQWNYSPNRQTAGGLVRFEAGNFDKTHWTGSIGVALSRVNWRPERQYLFAENTLNIGTLVSIFQTLQADQRNPKLMNGQTGAQLSQSFTTVRLQPAKRISFDLNHNYLRGVPTFDQRLIGTGLLDQYLFTGFSGGVRIEPISQLLLMGTWGQSRKNGDTTHSLNQYYSVGWKRLPLIQARVDLRYSKFSSSFGDGSYRSVAFSRDLMDNFRLQFEAGIQQVRSLLATQGKSRYFNTYVDWQLSRHYFLASGWLSYRGQTQNYDQFYTSLGYRFR